MRLIRMAQKDYMQNYRLPLAHRICDKIDLPEDIYRNCCHIEVTSDCYAIVDGCKGVLEYNSDKIKLNLGKKSVTFCGSCLTIKSLAQEQAAIEGLIVSIEFA